MPKLQPDETDPMELVGVCLPVPDIDTTRQMAECFVEEFVRLGRSAEELMAMFRNPFYGGAHRAYQALGEASIQELIVKYIRLFRPSDSSK